MKRLPPTGKKVKTAAVSGDFAPDKKQEQKREGTDKEGVAKEFILAAPPHSKIKGKQGKKSKWDWKYLTFSNGRRDSIR